MHHDQIIFARLFRCVFRKNRNLCLQSCELSDVVNHLKFVINLGKTMIFVWLIASEREAKKNIRRKKEQNQK